MALEAAYTAIFWAVYSETGTFPPKFQLKPYHPLYQYHHILSSRLELSSSHARKAGNLLSQPTSLSGRKNGIRDVSLLLGPPMTPMAPSTLGPRSSARYLTAGIDFFDQIP